MAKLKREYLNPKLRGSYYSLSTFLKNKDLKDSSQAKAELNNLKAIYLHTLPRKKFKRRKIISFFINHIWGMDLIDVSNLSHENRNYKWILIIVDAFSRKMFTAALKDKSANSVSRALSKIFKQVHPTYVWVDEGKEFFNSKVKSLLARYNIQMYHTYSPLKVSFVERAIRTLMTRIWRYFSHTGSKKYIDVLPLMTSSLNSTISSVTKFAPSKVTNKNSDEIFKNLYEKIILGKKPKPKYSVGDKVLISIQKSLFTKGYKPTWGEEEFQVSVVQPTDPPTYLLKSLSGEDITGGFYEQEMKRAPN